MNGHKNNNSRQDNGNHKSVKKCRVIALLSREEMEFLDKLGMDSLFSTGSKLSRSEIMSALVDAAMMLDLSAKGVKSKKELVQKFIDALQSYPDKRKLPRLKKNLVIRFRKIDSLGEHEGGTTVDVGVGGFKVDVAFLGKPLSPNQPIEIRINEPDRSNHAIRALGRVAWVKDREDGHSHEIGVMLTYIKEEDRDRFIKYLSEEKEVDRSERDN